MSDRWQDALANPTPPTVKVGQVWQSRRDSRRVLVMGTDGHFATVASVTGRRSRIRVGPDGTLPRYRLIAPATPEEPRTDG